MSILNSLFNNSQKVQIIDPLLCIVKLGIFSFLPEGTKIGFSNNTIYFQDPNAYQGITRFAHGDKRSDIHNLLCPIYWACKWYLSPKTSIREIFNYASKGLEKLKYMYKDNQVIYQCINYYILIIESYRDKDDDSELKKELDSFNSEEVSKSYVIFKSLWNEEEIKIIASLFDYLSKLNDKDKMLCIINCIETFLKIKF